MEKTQKLKEIQGCFKEQAFKESKGRRRKENSLNSSMMIMDEIDPFVLDIQKIVNSKAFRRLNGKTQVFTFPKNTLIRNRLTHSLEVKSIAETIAFILGLNVNLVGAIALGHDLGHAPFGHLGERFIQKTFDKNFRHEIFALTVAEKIERQGRGLNLSFETLEGITYHSRGIKNITLLENIPLEYNVLMLADKIAYLFSDINDARSLNKLRKSLPKEMFFLGDNQAEQINNCITALCLESAQKGQLSFSKSTVSQAFAFVRKWMIKNFYLVLDEEKERGLLWNKISKTETFFKKILEIEFEQIPLILATMTDTEIEAISLIDNKATIEDIKKIGQMEFYKNIPYCPKKFFSKEEILW